MNEKTIHEVVMYTSVMIGASEEKIYKQLQRKYLLIFLMANFVDWLQGPYLYKLYSSYGYLKEDICLFYVTGFISSAVSGVFVGHCADKFGRKKFCLFYFFATIFSCLLTLGENFVALHIGRIFGGISSSILFSTFESWYISEHLLKYNISKDLIGLTIANSTFYNSLLAIVAGCISSLFVDKYKFGPTSPFIFTIPVSLLSALLCYILWIENFSSEVHTSPFKALGIILIRSNGLMIRLGFIQTFFEIVIYIFIFLWTSILNPINLSNGIIFGGFMLCIVVGSALHSFLVDSYRISREMVLLSSIILALFSMIASTIGIHIQMRIQMEVIGTYVCLLSFLLFELSVGIYYPAIGYFRGIITPERHRASIASWYRLPSNILICLVLLYISFELPDTRLLFALSTTGLSIATLYCIDFIRIYHYNTNLHNDCSLNSYKLSLTNYT